jgi:lysophospholipase L1-like esterase
MVLYDANGNAIEVSGGISGEISDNSITPEKLSGVVENVFDLSQNTEENAFTDYAEAFANSSKRSWGGEGSYDYKYFSYLIPVNPGEKYYLQNIDLPADNRASAIFYTADKELTTQSGTLTAQFNAITVPATAAYMRIPVNANTVDTVMVLKGRTEPIDIYIPCGYVVPSLYGDIGAGSVNVSMLGKNAKPHRFYGAKVGCLGDSLTAMAATNTRSGWIYSLARKMGFASITSYGLSGTTVTSARGEGVNTYRDRAPNMSDDLDLIIVMTSINDNGAAYGVYNEAQDTGTREDATDKTVNDVSTIAGAGLALIDILRNKYPHSDIVFFSHPHTHWEWSFGEADMYREVCGRHSIPFFDLLRYSGMDGTYDADKTAYFTDGVHLTTAGNDRVADYMAACLRTL